MTEMTIAQIHQAKRAQKGDTDALYKLLESRADYLYRVAFLKLHKEEDCLDALQDATVQAIRSLSTLREPRYFFTWYTQILYHSCGAVLAKRIKHEHSDLAPFQEKIPERKRADNAENTEVKLDLNNALLRLNHRYRDALQLFYFQNLSIREISDRLNQPEGTVKTNLRRGKAELKEILGGDYYGK